MRNRTFWRRLIATFAVLAGLVSGAVALPGAATAATPAAPSVSHVLPTAGSAHSDDIWW